MEAGGFCVEHYWWNELTFCRFQTKFIPPEIPSGLEVLMPAIPPYPPDFFVRNTVTDTALTLNWFGWEGGVVLVLVGLLSFGLTNMRTPKTPILDDAPFLLFSFMMVTSIAMLATFYGSGWFLVCLVVSVMSFLGSMWCDSIKAHEQVSQNPTSNLEDEQIKRVVGMVQQGKCDDHMRQKLLDLATDALPKLLNRIAEHRAALDQLAPLRLKLPLHQESWNLSQQTLQERFRRVIDRLTRLEARERECRQHLDALEAIMLDDALTRESSDALDMEHKDLMAAVNETLTDARHQTDAHDEVDNLATNDVVDLTLHRNAAAKARTPDGY